MWGTPQEALNFYAALRTTNQKGVTIPSQIRYVFYTGELVNTYNYVLPDPETLLIKSIELSPPPNIPHFKDIRFSVHVGKTLVYSHKDAPLHKKKGKGQKSEEEEEEALLFELPAIPVCGDIRVEFSSDSRLFAFWFNSSFVKNNVLEMAKSELDKANKDKNKIYAENFKCVVVFEKPETKVDLKSLTGSAKIDNNNNSTHEHATGEGILNTDKWTTPARNACEVAEGLLKILIEILVSKTPSRQLDSSLSQSLLSEIKESKRWRKFSSAVCELQKVALDKLSLEEKLTFWVNTFNLLALHSNVLLLSCGKVPGNASERFQQSSKTKYIIADQVFSLLDIEFAILRAAPKMTTPNEFVAISTKFEPNDLRSAHVVPRADPRINFALNPGVASAPPIRVYHVKAFFEEIEQSTRLYLQENLSINDSNEVTLPKILDWYCKDFAKDEKKMLKAVLDYFTPEQKSKIPKNAVIKFKDFDWNLHYSFKHFDVEVKH